MDKWSYLLKEACKSLLCCFLTVKSFLIRNYYHVVRWQTKELWSIWEILCVDRGLNCAKTRLDCLLCNVPDYALFFIRSYLAKNRTPLLLHTWYSVDTTPIFKLCCLQTIETCALTKKIRFRRFSMNIEKWNWYIVKIRDCREENSANLLYKQQERYFVSFFITPWILKS